MLKKIGQGNTAEIFQVSDDKIVKLYRLELSEKAISDEYMMSSRVHAYGISTPKPIEKIKHDNRHGIVFERVSGVTLLDRMRKRPFQIRKLAKIMATLHYQLHVHEATDIHITQKAVLSQSINDAPFLTNDEKSKIIDYMRNLPDDNKLCHGDFHPDNVLCGTKYWIIDWMTGVEGNPCCDIARSLVIMSYGTMPKGTPLGIKLIVNYFRRRMKNHYIRQYLKVSGKNMVEIDAWILPVAAARLLEWIPEGEKKALVNEIRRRLRLIC